MTDPAAAKTLLIVGLGDLGKKIALRLCASPEFTGQLVFLGREPQRTARFAALCTTLSDVAATVESADIVDGSSLAACLRRVRPTVVLHAASLLSPFALEGRSNRITSAIESAGYAVRISAHLFSLRSLMLAVRESATDCLVVNASHPDVAHSMLAAESLAPLVGIGNVGMIARRIRPVLCQHDLIRAGQILRVFGHHSQVAPIMSGQWPASELFSPPPRVFVEDEEVDIKPLFKAVPALPRGAELNHLSAACAVEVLLPLLGMKPSQRISVPGPYGLPGGYPVVISQGAVALDLPSSFSLAQARAEQTSAARLDGVEKVTEEGVLYYTQEAQQSMARLGELGRAMTQPLRLDKLHERWTILAQLLDEEARLHLGGGPAT